MGTSLLQESVSIHSLMKAQKVTGEGIEGDENWRRHREKVPERGFRTHHGGVIPLREVDFGKARVIVDRNPSLSADNNPWYLHTQ